MYHSLESIVGDTPFGSLASAALICARTNSICEGSSTPLSESSKLSHVVVIGSFMLTNRNGEGFIERSQLPIDAANLEVSPKQFNALAKTLI